jgi:hypothetical protein
VDDGVMLCKLANIAKAGIIDDRVLVLNPPNIFEKKNNINLALGALGSLGVKIIGINA